MSSLLNARAGSERTIVTATAGTTRDMLRETVHIDDVEILLACTAGLRAHGDDASEREGMRRARAEHAHADLLIAVIEDGDNAAERALRAELAALAADDAQTSVLWLHNKCDRSGRVAGLIAHPGEQHLAVSAKTGAGLDELRRPLREHVGGGACEAGAFSARRRHVDALHRAGQAPASTEAKLAQGAGELLAEDLRAAQHALGEITGAVDAEALLGEIFSNFRIEVDSEIRRADKVRYRLVSRRADPIHVAPSSPEPPHPPRQAQRVQPLRTRLNSPGSCTSAPVSNS